MPGLSPTSKLIGCFDAGSSALAVSEAGLPLKAELLHRGYRGPPAPGGGKHTSHSLRRPDTEMLFHPLPLAHLLPGGVGKAGPGWGMNSLGAAASPLLNQSIVRAPRGGPWRVGAVPWAAASRPPPGTRRRPWTQQPDPGPASCRRLARCRSYSTCKGMGRIRIQRKSHHPAPCSSHTLSGRNSLRLYPTAMSRGIKQTLF